MEKIFLHFRSVKNFCDRTLIGRRHFLCTLDALGLKPLLPYRSILKQLPLTEIAYMNDLPPALKARAELTRRNSELSVRLEASSKQTLFWARFAGWAAVLGVIVAVVAIALPAILAK